MPILDIGPGDFAQLAQYASNQHKSNSSPYQVAPVIATYASQKHRLQSIKGALEEDRAQYEAGVTVSSATRFYPAQRGGIGMVTSPLQNSAEVSAGKGNDWHTVGVLRKGKSLWVYDPAYKMGSQTRLTTVPGVSSVIRLLGSEGFGSITQVQISGDGSEEADCMARAAEWVDRVIGAGTEPYPEGSFVEGEAMPGWQTVARF